jgi:hypothetical protein
MKATPRVTEAEKPKTIQEGPGLYFEVLASRTG